MDDIARLYSYKEYDKVIELADSLLTENSKNSDAYIFKGKAQICLQNYTGA